MKRMITMLLAAICTFGAASAANTLTATVTRTVHKAAVKKDNVTKGTFDYKKGGTMTMTFGATDKMLMEGTTYTIVSGKRKVTAKGDVASLFGVLQSVVDDIFAGGSGEVSSAKSKGVSISRAGNTITLKPIASSEKKKKTRYTSFVITIDASRHQVKSIRMNGRAGNYTDYELSSYK